MSRRAVLVVTCEHGGNEVPAEYAAAFAEARDALESHRGYDPGTLELAGEFAAALAASLHVATVSRLVVELNRSPRHRALFSEFTRVLPREARADLLARYYRPYRDAVEAHIGETIGEGNGDAIALHVSVHSFSPVMNGVERRADVGLLYDPRRPLEREYCGRRRDALMQHQGDLIVRRNYPYRGVADGLVTHLRRRFAADRYVGVELEVNQKHPLAGGAAWARLKETLIQTLAMISRTTAP